MAALISTVFAALPVELVDLVLAYAALAATPMDLASLAHIALVSRRSNEMATPLLYSTIIIDTEHKLQAFQHVFHAKPTTFFVAYVRAFSISLPVSTIDPAQRGLSPLFGIGSGLAFIQAPIDIILGIFRFQRDDHAPRKLSILRLSGFHEETWGESLRALPRLLAGTSHLHFSGQSQVAQGLFRGALKQIPPLHCIVTHVSVDGDNLATQPAGPHQEVWVQQLQTLLTAPLLERLVVRFPERSMFSGSAMSIAALLGHLQDPRVYLHVDRAWDASTTSFAVDGWLRDIAGLQDLWTPGKVISTSS